MSTFISREIAKMTIDKREIYVCMYVHGETTVNLTYFEKIKEGFKELLIHNVSDDLKNELVKRTRSNSVDKVTPLEAKAFNESLNRYNYLLATKMKEVLKKRVSTMKIDYIGEIAGIHYLVSSASIMDVKQLFLLQPSKTEGEYEIGVVPPLFVEMIVLDYVHHVQIKNKPTYLMVTDKQIIGLKKKDKLSRIIYVVSIEITIDSISASKAYIISKKSNYEYTLLSSENNTPELMEGLKKEGQSIVDQFAEVMNKK